MAVRLRCCRAPSRHPRSPAARTVRSPARPARAQGLTAARYHQLCADRGSPLWTEIGQWLCPSYLRGLIEGARIQALRTAGSVEGAERIREFYEPAGSTGDGAIGLVVRAIEAHPEARGEPIATVAYRALREAWPCR